MNVVMRLIDGKWSVAADGVTDEALAGALLAWRALGYTVTWFRA